MEGCPHVRQLQLAANKSLLNPRTWACCDCGTTDSVWACLLCSHVACGRACEGHALRHFELTKHPVAIEVNQRYVHCYLCDEYVFNDNASGDIGLVRSLLVQVASQHYQESYTRSGHVIKPAITFMRAESRVEEVNSAKADKRYTALCHWRYLLLSTAFNTWRVNVATAKQSRVEATAPAKLSSVVKLKRLASLAGPAKRKHPLSPGMTGLRNLGNTCYMNAVLQSLGHLAFFRECFRQLPLPREGSFFNRQTTVECFQHISTRPPRRPRLVRQDRLVGGAGGGGRRRREAGCPTVPEDEQLPLLCHEMHRLMRVMWSGKWAVVTPHTVLNTVWRLIPTFHGYTQQDAQEFLCELLDRLQGELDQWPLPHTITLSTPHRDVTAAPEILPALFQGSLASQVEYERCGHCSRVEELFWDLSLDFPERYHQAPSTPHRLQTRSSVTDDCDLHELLDNFTAAEELEGEIFVCEKCAAQQDSNTAPQCARKRLSIASPPDVLRLHFKRFRWCGRMRHKITAHVSFPVELYLGPYCIPALAGWEGGREGEEEGRGEESQCSIDSLASEPDDFLYCLSSVVIHHGMGLASGHYTSYCWNGEAESWVHCNDARTTRCSEEEVLSSQAYILFYVRQRGRSAWAGQDQEEPSAKRRKLI